MARHFLIWLQSNGTPLEGVDDSVMREFRDHKCVCELGRGGAGRYRRKSKKYQWYFVGVVYFVQFLEDTGHTRHPGERELGMRVLEKYIQQCENQGYRKSTIESIVVASKHFLSWLHTRRISITQLQQRTLRNFLDTTVSVSTEETEKEFSPKRLLFGMRQRVCGTFCRRRNMAERQALRVFMKMRH